MFLNDLKEYKETYGYKLLAYCLMGNHVHLLIKEGSEGVEQAFKRIDTRFVYWYNAKCQRVGRLFQDRYRSEVVENERYLCTVIRYIHQNPIKAGICRQPEDYPYSSFREYLGKPMLVDLDCVEQYVTVPAVVKMSRQHMTEECLEMRGTPPLRVTEQSARQQMKELIGCDSLAAFQLLKPTEKTRCVQRMKKAGMSVRQISRLAGTSY